MRAPLSWNSPCERGKTKYDSPTIMKKFTNIINTKWPTLAKTVWWKIWCKYACKSKLKKVSCEYGVTNRYRINWETKLPSPFSGDTSHFILFRSHLASRDGATKILVSEDWFFWLLIDIFLAWALDYLPTNLVVPCVKMQIVNLKPVKPIQLKLQFEHPCYNWIFIGLDNTPVHWTGVFLSP